MRKRTCTDCNGTGKAFDFLSYLFDPRTWMPFSINWRPAGECRSCSGKGWWWEDWRDYSHRYGRRR